MKSFEELLTKEENNIFRRIMKYKNQTFEKYRLTNPCITKRETIYLANAIDKIIKSCSEFKEISNVSDLQLYTDNFEFKELD